MTKSFVLASWIPLIAAACGDLEAPNHGDGSSSPASVSDAEVADLANVPGVADLADRPAAVGAADGPLAPPFDAGYPACEGTFPNPFPHTAGFQPEPSEESFQAVVTEVAADYLMLQRTTGDSVTFVWSGPSLASAFVVNEKVSCQRIAGWSIVKGTRHTAEFFEQISSTSLSFIGTIPGGGNYTLAPQCANVSSPTCSGARPIVDTFYQVVASLGGDSVEIPMQATATLGAWQITNVFHRQSSGGNIGFCHVDFTQVGRISALGPP